MNKIFQNKKIVAIIGGIILLLVVGFIVFVILDSNKDKTNNDDNNNGDVGGAVENNKEEDIELDIIDVKSNSRPIAVMINNINFARKYQSGLQDAYVVYEMITEGGITRMMALFKDKNTARIGSVRSSRHYFLDYVLEHDAIYVHWGGSPQAYSNISSYGINNIDGGIPPFYEDSDVKLDSEHRKFISMENIIKTAKNKSYNMTTNKELLLNYSEDELNISEKEDSKVANSVDIKYSGSYITNYVYNSNDKVYYRSVNDAGHIDYVTKKQYTAKNIIVAFMKNSLIPGDKKGRQNLDNIGSGEGYFITNGYAVPITWEKSSRKAQTIYKYKNGEEIKVNDGNTFIQNAPLNSATIK